MSQENEAFKVTPLTSSQAILEETVRYLTEQGLTNEQIKPLAASLLAYLSYNPDWVTCNKIMEAITKYGTPQVAAIVPPKGTYSTKGTIADAAREAMKNLSNSKGIVIEKPTDE